MNVDEAKELFQKYPPAERDAVAAVITRVAVGAVNQGGVPAALVSITLLALAIDIWQQAHGLDDLEEVFTEFMDHSMMTYDEEGEERDED